MTSPLESLALILFVLVAVPIPIGTDHTRRRFPWVTYGLIVANALVFVWMQFLSRSAPPGYNPFAQWGLVPQHPHVYSLLTYLFLHVSVSHILWNMAFLWLFGRDVEDALGHAMFLVFFLGGGIAAGLLHVAIVQLFAENSLAASAPLAGASGAIAAILGFYAVRFYGAKLQLRWIWAGLLDKDWGRLQIPAIWGLTLWIVQTVIGAILFLVNPNEGGIAYWAHIGGFIIGIVTAVLTDMLGEGAREYLLTEAKVATASGDDRGLAAAVRRYWVILQRRPADEETHAALEELVRQTAQSGQAGGQALAAECAALLEVSQSLGDRDHAVAWYLELRACGFDPPLPPRMLAFLAECFLQKEDFATATKLYQRLLKKFPNAPEAEWTYLELATLLIGHMNASTDAATLLHGFLGKYPASAHRALALNLLDSAMGRTPTK